jgi:hypothetical protein
VGGEITIHGMAYNGIRHDIGGVAFMVKDFTWPVPTIGSDFRQGASCSGLVQA